MKVKEMINVLMQYPESYDVVINGDVDENLQETFSEISSIFSHNEKVVLN